MQCRYHLFALIVLPLLASCFAAPGYQGPESDHFDGKVFSNTVPMEKSAGDMIRLGWGSLTQAADWPQWVDTEQHSITQERLEQGLSVTFINHASFLIQVDGINILTDPVYSERTSPVGWAGPKRVNAPGVALEALPPIDMILISHNHYDHLDTDTLSALIAQQEQPPLILAGLGNGALLREIGATASQDMDWGDSTTFNDTEFIFAECRHRSGRGISDQMKTLWGAFVIKTPSGNLYIGGDTGYGAHFKATGEAHGPFLLSLLPIGAYEPRWFMRDVHLNPEEAVRAHQDLRSQRSIGMHFGTFQLTYEPINKPVEDLAVAMEAASIAPPDFRVMTLGETWRVVPDD